MPTLGAAAPQRLAQAEIPPVPVSVPAARTPRRVESEGNPLWRNLAWVLAGIGLVMLVLLGAQKLLFNNPVTVSQSNPDEQTSQPAATQTQPVVPTSEKPSPVGESPTHTSDTVKPSDRAPSPPAPPQTAATPPSPAGERTIQLLTDPPGATVEMDGDPARSCKTPCMLSLPSGRHTMTTQLDGYRPYPRVISVPQDSDQFLKLAKTLGTLSVTSTPPGATIHLNGEAQPQKTPASFNIAPGTYHVRVTRDGVPLDFDVEVKDGEFQNRNVNFQ